MIDEVFDARIAGGAYGETSDCQLVRVHIGTDVIHGSDVRESHGPGYRVAHVPVDDVLRTKLSHLLAGFGSIDEHTNIEPGLDQRLNHSATGLARGAGDEDHRT